MDDISTRTIIIGVNIFVTVTIVSLIVIMFSQMGDIYGVVARTDNAISSTFDDVYSMYNGRVETGVGLLNTIKTLEEDNEYGAIIKYPGSDAVSRYTSESISEAQYLKGIMEGSIKNNRLKKYKYEDRYTVIVYENLDGTIIIEFK